MAHERKIVKRRKSKRSTKGFVKSTPSKKKNGGFYGGVERKFLDTTRAQQAMSTSWAPIVPSAPAGIECLTIPVTGTGEEEHIGRTYFINSIFVKGLITRNVVEGQGAPLGDLQWRICLVWDTQTNGTTVVASDVMDITSLNDVLSFRNLSNSSRFIVLGDTGLRNFPVFNMNEGAENMFASPGSDQYWELSKTFKTPIKVRTDGTTGVIADVTDNSFTLIGITSNTVALVEFESRMRFSEQST